MDAAAHTVLDAVAAEDWEAVRLALHPYLHWEEPGAPPVRGRTRVLERLRDGPPPAPPRSVELRDGQVYRWRA